MTTITAADKDLLYVFTGVSSARIVDAFRRVLAGRAQLQAGLAERLTRYPMETLAGFLLASSAAFYLAERDDNPKVKTFVDAIYYISTCLSVGYADIFPVTQRGRAIATLVMTLGPAMTGEVLDPPGRAAGASERATEMMIERLDAILEELKRADGRTEGR